MALLPHIRNLAVGTLLSCAVSADGHGTTSPSERPRARDLGIEPGVFPPAPLNAITDVEGVRVGHVTQREGDDVRTGVTAIVPHGGNIYRERVPAAIVVGNGFGKLVGFTQVQELGEIETPILLTNTLAVWDAAKALVDHTLEMEGNENVRSVNPVVGETNDGWLNEIRRRSLTADHFARALRSAKPGPVDEGSVGAGTGTRAFGYKGGIGTSSRRLPASLGGHTVGVLVQTNFGGVLQVDGIQLGKEAGDHAFAPKTPAPRGDGSCMIVVATDAPADARQLRRVADRALAGMARTGSSFSHGSGDYVIAFSTAAQMRRTPGNPSPPSLPDESLSPLFQAAAEATEEAIYNSLLQATTVRGRDGHEAPAIPLNALRRALAKRTAN